MKRLLFFLCLLTIFSACDRRYSKYSEQAPQQIPSNTLAYEEEVEMEPEQMNTEQYDLIVENDFRDALTTPLSTFSIDVDNASYSNTRRFLTNGNLPPKDAVRIEEFINYFNYQYTQPDGSTPIAIHTEVAECPWNPAHRLVQIGLQGKRIERENMPPTNLVFLLDVSGSMSDFNKLPLLKNAFKLLVNELRDEDRIAIVVYAGASGVVLPSTPGSDKRKILDALDRLQSGGSTAGAEGIQLAYKVAEENLIAGGNNRIMLATDGDFNVGPSSDGALVRMIEEKRKKGVSLSVLGFGMGNYKDSKMEKLADNGDGNYYYIDNIREARKVLISQMSETLYTIAKDVKLQIEFNPAQVKEYRLIGYENRLLRDEDFNDDTKDAGDIGAGHTVTAFYEIVPQGSSESKAGKVDPLKYQKREMKASAQDDSDLLTVKLRYKMPQDTTSQLLAISTGDQRQKFADASQDFRFATAVAGFGLLLRGSKYKGNLTFEQIKAIALETKGTDVNGYRAEFIGLVDLANGLVAVTASEGR